jgi:phage baseplate assembly protein W
MPTYIGFSTVDINQPRVDQRPGVFGGIGSVVLSPRQGRKFSLTDEQLVVRDLLNALSIKQGDKVGQPTYGTTLWSYVFEPATDDVRDQIETEVRRVIALDPRIVLNSVGAYEQENGFLLQIELAFSPFNQATQIDFFLNRFDGSIQQLSQ